MARRPPGAKLLPAALLASALPIGGGAWAADDSAKGESAATGESRPASGQGADTHKTQNAVSKAANQTAEALKGAAQKVGPVVSDSFNGARKALGFRDKPSSTHKDASGQVEDKGSSGSAPSPAKQ